MSNSKVIYRALGGLGNQLFGYAAARRIALMNNCEIVIDDITGFKYDHIYKRTYQLHHFNIPKRLATRSERMEPFSRLRRYILRKHESRKPFLARKYIMQDKVDFDNRVLSIKVYDTLYIEGYWQSERYFIDFKDIIRNEFQIIPPDDQDNIAMSKQISSSNAVALHLRYFDNTEGSESNNISSDYYNRAVLYLENKLSDAHYYVFSDRPDLVKEVSNIPTERITFVKHNTGDDNAFADLWLMQQCSHFIIANSTFSWWGAWLGNNPSKIVIAPDIVKRSGDSWWGFDGLLPEDWILL